MSIFSGLILRCAVALSFFALSTASLAANISADFYNFYESDYNGDGLPDIVLKPKLRILMQTMPLLSPVDFSEKPLVFVRKASGEYTTIYPADSSIIATLALVELPYELYAGDFNGDGIPDLLFQSDQNQSQTFIAYSDLTGRMPKALSYLGMYGVSRTAASVEIKDLQGDGISDIVFTLNGGSTKFAFGGSAFIQASDLQLNNVVPGAQVEPLFDGAFQVDESGAATYSFDIELPPVPSGMKPDFGINYSSSAGNGTLGVGWSITGESAITRCPTSYVEDGYVDRVDFDGNDQFCLDGIRLVLKSGVHGQDGAEYRLANDNAQRIFIRGSLAGGPQKFEVQSPKGAKSFYGETADSRFGIQGGKASIWSQSSAQNVFGDFISYSYNTDKSTGEHYLINTSYGQYQVVFEYEDRPDISSGFIAPALKSVQKNRLKKILINRPDKTLVYYTFSFSNNADGQGANYSYLNAINVCISETQCKLATRWHWTEFKSDSFWAVIDPMNKGIIRDWDDYSFTLGEWNHDGLTDVLWQERSAGYNNWFFARGDGNFDAAELLSRSQVDYGFMDGGDWNGDGLDDAMFFDPNSGNADWFINSRSSPKSFTPVRFFDAGLAKNKGLSYGDWNGDGLTDILVYQSSTGNNDWLVNSGNLSFFHTPLAIAPVVIDGKSWTTGDWNGDGIDDFFWYDKGDGRNRWYINDANWQATGATSIRFEAVVDNPVATAELASGNSIIKRNFYFGDWNSDGIQDFMTHYAPTGANRWYINDGTAHFEKFDSIIPPADITGYNSLSFADWNGDGLLDLMAHNYSSGDNRWFVGVGSLSFRTVAALGVPNGNVDQECKFRVGDFDANGTSDFMCYGSELGDNRWYYSQGERMAVIDRFIDPMGDETIINYELLNKTNAYTREYTNEAFVSTVTPAMKVVTKVTTDNGVGGQHVTKYKYAGYKVHTRGYGELGFHITEAIDGASGIRTLTEYSQDYLGRKVGMVTRTESRYVKNGQNIKLNETVNTNAVQEISYGSAKVRMPYLARQEVSSWDFANPGLLLGTVKTDYTYDDYGNIKTQTTVTTDPAPITGGVFTSFKETKYRLLQESPYLVGLPERIDSTSTVPDETGSGQLTDTRSTSFQYNDNGTPKNQVVQPGNAKALTTSFGYNAKGQVTTTTVSGADVISRVTTTQYDAEGRESAQINALGHITTYAYENLDYPWLRTKTIDPNGQSTVTSYDAWGRAPTVTAADGTSITQQTKWCDVNCEMGEVYYSETTASIGKPSFVFFDKEGREVRRSSFGFDGTGEGRLIHVRTEYNAIGKVARHSEPHFDGDVPQWNQTWYDDLGRPQVAFDASGSPMTYVHNGRTVQSTNALGQSKIVETNAHGQTIKVTDADGNTIEYGYGPFGELLYTKDSKGPTRAAYDIFGNKTSMQDLDKGNWSYEYDAFGQLKTQKDARGWVTYHEYDKLGRLTKRVDRYGTANAETSTWEYDLADLGTLKNPDNSARKALGLLNRTVKGAFVETYEFDTLGRQTKTYTTIDAVVYLTATTYDSYSRPVTLAYPGTGLTIKNEYHPTLGMLQRVKNNSTGAEYWELQETNARGQVSLMQLGNLLTTSRTFNQQTGYLETIMTYTSASPGTFQQQMDFTFDNIGNLAKRMDLMQGVQEDLTYDNLNRLLTSDTTTPLQTYKDSITYDAAGNIITKSGVGTYRYGEMCGDLNLVPRLQAGPHAVTSIIDGKNTTYCYDQNGNMIAGDGRAITYTAQDVPKKITKGSNSVEFFYGPDQQRYKRIDIEGGVTTTTVNIGAYEKIRTGSDTTTKYYLGNFAVVSRKNSEPLKTKYLMTDHQGSIVGSYDPLGAGGVPVVEYMSFDPWGKRRAVNWAPMSFTDLYLYKSNTTNRGYTGHEHVDSMGLIHMNGRMYDPVIGRFLSADPFVQDATNTQSLNRYSYVMNNPLSMTDPSGFFWKKLKKAFKKIARAVVKAVRAVARAIVIVGLGNLYALHKLHHWMWDKTKEALTRNKYLGQIATMAVCANPATAAACVPFSMAIASITAYGATGDWNMALRAGVTAAAAAYIGGKLGVGKIEGNLATKLLVGGALSKISGAVTGGIVSTLQGGSFRDAFKAGMKFNGRGDMLIFALSTYLNATAEDEAAPKTDCDTGAPIDIRTGRKFLVITDLQTGRLKFVRHYNSFANEPSTLGGKWRHEFEKKLIITKHGPVVVAVRGDGQHLEFNIDRELNKPTKAKGRFNETLRQVDDRWQLTNDDDSVEIYNAEGVLLSITERDGYVQFLNYENGKLVSISDSEGRHIDLRYNYRGMLVEVTSTGGNAVGYRYNQFGALASVRMPDGTEDLSDNSRVQYLYEDARFVHALTGMVDEGGKRFGTWRYDEQMRAFYEHTEGQSANRLEYRDGNVTNLTDALGRTTTYHYNDRGQPELVEGHPTASCIGSNNQYEYDDNGFLKSKTDWNGNRTEFTHNDRGLETSRTEAAGTAEAITVTTEWHDTYRLPVVITRPGSVTRYQYDESGLLLEKAVVDTTSEARPERVWRYAYNDSRELVQVDGPREDVADTSTFEYDANGNQTAIVNALQHRMAVLEHNADGLPSLMQDQNGGQIRLQYNARGWLTEKAARLDSGEWAATRFEYTGIGDYEGVGLIRSVTKPNGASLRYEYNAARQVTAVSNNAGERIEYQLDNMGNRTVETLVNAQGDIKRQQRSVYDELSRLLQSLGADGYATHFTYDPNGNVTRITDALGRNTRNAYDALNRLTSSVDALGGETSTDYNEQGQVAKVTDARGIVTRYDYNGFGEVTKLTSQDTGVTTYAYDSAGNKVEQRNANGIVTRYRYDALNRLQAVEYPSSPADNIAYQYDVATLNAVGRVSKVQDASGATERAYDSRGNVVQEVRTIGNAHYAIGYAYDSADNLIAMTYPNGVTIRYQQDAAGRVERISRYSGLGENTLLDNIHYLPFGPISSLRYGNGLTDQREHDRDYRLQQQRVADLYRKAYEYDPVGNITSILDQQQAANDKHYEYDELSRLTVASTGMGDREQFSYDAVGNRIAYQQVANGDVVQQQAYQYADTSNRLLAVNQGATQRSFQYDDAGNTVKDSGVEGEKRALEYGANNRLQMLTKDGLPAARYQHNSQGQRVIKVVNGEEAHFIYDINDRLIAEANASGQIRRQYVYLGREPVAMQVAANDQWYFVHNDHLGTPKLVTDADAQVVWRGEAKAFGETLETGSLKFGFRFPGQMEDGESGYFYNYFRDYDASVGRYLQSDPIGLVAGSNTYSYVEGDSINSHDYYGLCGLSRQCWAYVATQGTDAFIAGNAEFGASYAIRGYSARESAYRGIVTGAIAFALPGSQSLAKAPVAMAISGLTTDGVIDPVSMLAGTGTAFLAGKLGQGMTLVGAPAAEISILTTATDTAAMSLVDETRERWNSGWYEDKKFQQCVSY